MKQRSVEIIQEGEFEKYKNLTSEEQREKFLEIQGLLSENKLPVHEQAKLQFQLGFLLVATQKYEEALTSHDKVLEFEPNNYIIWYLRGILLKDLGRYEEAVTSYDKSLSINPKNDSIWYNRGNAIGNLGRYEEAVTSYDKSLEINPDNDSAWDN